MTARPQQQDSIRVVGARAHNLRNISVDIPRDSLTVITGLSGSGKSSLAFDTLYAEGQRRYVESLSAYARQFLGQMDKPDVDHIDGLSPAISIDQKTTSRNPRSTVATVTEVYDYLRLLYARVGEPHCPICARPIAGQSAEQITERILGWLPEGTRFQILAPLVRGRKGEHKDVLERIRTEGFVRVAVDGVTMAIEAVPDLEKTKSHTIEVVVDRLVMKDDVRRRLAESIETATTLAEGLVRVEEVGGEERDQTFSERFACPEHGASLAELAPRIFSFNSPHGACETCTGLGFRPEVDPELVVAAERTLAAGAVLPWADRTTDYYDLLLVAVSNRYGVDLHTPWNELSEDYQQLILNGPGKRERISLGRRRTRGFSGVTWFEGVMPQLRRQHASTGSEAIRDRVEEFMSLRPCPSCDGARLKPESLAVTVGGLAITAVTGKSVAETLQWIRDLKLSDTQEHIAVRIRQEVTERLRFLDDVGVGYLTLDRSAGSLSGGEAQRIRLATQIGAGLVGVLYILDEPSIGLHQRDNHLLIGTLERLRDLGNTVIVVEHDEDMMRTADHVIDMGPGAGEHGGEVVAEGPLAAILAEPRSVTGAYLSGRRSIPIPAVRREAQGHLTVRGARENNLRGVDVTFPVAALTCVTGVSGSGKSTLVNEILLKALASRLNRTPQRPGRHDGIDGLEHFDKVISIDQSPIGRTPRSNPATYTGLFDHIRTLYSLTPEARARGWTPGRFSFNVKGGRCEACKGEGTITIEMHFLPDVYVPCDICAGKRYNRETLEVRYKGATIHDVLEMSITDATEFFQPVPRIHRRLETLSDVGLGYVRLGQPATTLSGGEAQRVKLASELSKVATGRTMYVLDEPTTGLHFADIERLLQVLQRLVDAGNTAIVIEHNLDVIKSADWVVDLGPEGGAAGGLVLVAGTPEEIAGHAGSDTGRFLAPLLTAAPPVPVAPPKRRARKVVASR